MKLQDLLPYKITTSKRPPVAFEDYLLLVRALIEALSCFQSRAYERFDSVVGDDACQIRAVWLTYLAHKTQDGALESLKEAAVQLEEKLKHHRSPPHRKSVYSLFERNNFSLPLTHDAAFLLRSFLLTEIKTVETTSACFKATADPKRLKKYAHVSSLFVDALVSKLRKDLAWASIDFVRNHVALVEELHLMLSDAQIIYHNHRYHELPTLPTFWIYKALLKIVSSARVSLVLRVKFLDRSKGNAFVRDDYLFFHHCHDEDRFTLHPLRSALSEKAVCVVEGAVSLEDKEIPLPQEWRARITSFSLEEILLSTAADLPQHPGAAHEDRLHTTEEFLSYRLLAKLHGFSLQNPSTFFLQHVYAACPHQLLRAVLERLA